MAQELGGLGEMLEISAFKSLCDQLLSTWATPERVEGLLSLLCKNGGDRRQHC